jgi:hypothetical protein
MEEVEQQKLHVLLWRSLPEQTPISRTVMIKQSSIPVAACRSLAFMNV